MRILISSAVCILLGISLLGQSPATAPPSPQPGPPYHLFNGVSQDTVIEKLNQYGAMGYRFLAEAVAEGGAHTVIMEKSSSGTYQYVYASGTLHKSKFEESLNANGAQGFRYIHGTARGGPHAGGMLSAPLCAGLMEKASGADETYRYEVMDPMRQGSFAKDLADAAAAGFQPVEAGSMAELGLLFGPGDRNLVIVERSSRKPPQTHSVASSYRMVGISKLKDREKRMAENVAQGYRTLFTGYGTSGLHSEQSAFFALLERSLDAADAVHSNAERPAGGEYRFLDAGQKGVESEQAAAFVGQLNDAAASGYEPVGWPISRIFNKRHVRFSAVLERSDRKLEYQLATADDTPGLSRRLAESWEQGFRVPPMGLLSNRSAIVERELTGTQSKAP